MSTPYSVSIACHSVSTPRLWPSQTVFFLFSKAALFGTPSQYPRAGTPSQYCAPAARRPTPGERRRKAGKAEDEQDLACPALTSTYRKIALLAKMRSIVFSCTHVLFFDKIARLVKMRSIVFSCTHVFFFEKIALDLSDVLRHSLILKILWISQTFSQNRLDLADFLRILWTSQTFLDCFELPDSFGSLRRSLIIKT